MSPRPLRIFISYSHVDEADKDRPRISLSPLVQTGLAELWDDREILAGADWLAEIEGALAGADAALFLVSPDFLASRFCIENCETCRTGHPSPGRDSFRRRRSLPGALVFAALLC